MLGNQSVASRPIESVLSTNKVIRSTYQLLSMTLVFSAFMAYLSISMQASQGMGLVATIVGIVMLWFVLPRTANSASGIPVIPIILQPSLRIFIISALVSRRGPLVQP